MKSLLLFWLAVLPVLAFGAASQTWYFSHQASPTVYRSTAADACHDYPYPGGTFFDANGGTCHWDPDGSGPQGYTDWGSYASKKLCADLSNPDTTKPADQQCADAVPPLPADPNCPVGMHVFTWATPEDPQFPPQPICMPDGDPGTDIPENIPENQCSYRNPITNKCEAACPNGSYYGQVPTGAMACIKTDTGKVNNDNLPSDCPRGYMNISATSEPNCTPVPSNAPGQPTRPPGSAGETTKPTPSTTQTTTGPTTTTINGDGGTTETHDSTVTNRDGSTTTTTTTRTTDANGKVTESTSSTTSAAPNGVAGKSDSQADDKNDLCIRHPELTICQVSSVTQADCAATVCKGDAIECAMLRQQMKEYCQNTTDTASSTLGKSLASGNDPMQGSIDTALAGTSTDLSSQSLDQAGFVGGGGCFADRSITVLGQSVSVSFSTVCDHIAGLRYAVLACSLLAAYLLVSKSVLQG